MNKSMAKTTHRLAMMASVAVLAISASVFDAGAFADEQGANSPQQSTVQPKQLPKHLPQQQTNQKLNQAVQQQQKQIELQQQQKLQQQKQAEKTLQQQQLQQQKQAQQTRLQQQKQAEIQHFDWNTYRPGQRPPLWAQYRQNFDPRPYQWAGIAPRQYVVRYVPPPGWQYQRWSYGQVYPRPYWQQPYWLTNYSQYGLQPLPYGYVWVQNGPDALAVDSFTGVILQVMYGLFASGGRLL